MLLAPHALETQGGNAITVLRLAAGLRERGHDVVCAAAGSAVEPVATDVVHAFHAIKSGPKALEIAGGRPVVVTLTGTDLNEADEAALIGVLSRVDAVVVFNEQARDRVQRLVPGGRCSVIPQAVRFDGVRLAEVDLGVVTGAPLFVLVAGLRPVKRPMLPVRPLERLRASSGLDVQYRIIGPALDRDYAASLDFPAGADGRAWARWMGPVPHDAMQSVYAQATVVLNCSLSEGMSGALLEAMSLGCAVLASDIEGNRALIEHGRTGLLFEDETSFFEGAAALVNDAALRQRLGAAAREYYERQFSVSAELDAHEGIYRSLH